MWVGDACVCVCVRAVAAHLPAGVGGLPLQDVLGERRRLQLVLVKGHLVYDHGLGVQAGEVHVGVRRARRLPPEEEHSMAACVRSQSTSPIRRTGSTSESQVDIKALTLID